jgi:hypothetical protein
MHSIWLHGSNVDCYTTVCEQLKSSGVFTVELVALRQTTCGGRAVARKSQIPLIKLDLWAEKETASPEGGWPSKKMPRCFGAEK